MILSIIIPGVFVPLLNILSSKNADTLPTITAIKNLNLPILHLENKLYMLIIVLAGFKVNKKIIYNQTAVS